MAIFLSGVANADVFSEDEMISSAKTLIDSSITVGVQRMRSERDRAQNYTQKFSFEQGLI